MIPILIGSGAKFHSSAYTKPLNLANLLYLGIGACAVCFVTWNYAVKMLGAIKTSAYIYAIPVITIVVSVIILHEKVTLYVRRNRIDCIGAGDIREKIIMILLHH